MDEAWPAYEPATGIAESEEEASFELSPASAEQITMQIRTMVERAWEYIAIAYQGRAYAALGYRSWDEYVDDRLGDLRLTVPREQRAHAVAALSNARMSLRAIAKVLGVGLGTIHRDVSAGRPETDGNPDNVIPISVEGRDGKHYPRRKNPAATCSICGDPHPPGTEECPWDLFAQGIGPRPTPDVVVSDSPTSGSAIDIENRPKVRAVPDLPRPQHGGTGESENEPGGAIAEAVTRAACMVDQLDDLPCLIEEIEQAGSPRGRAGFTTGVAASLRELIDRLRGHARATAQSADRLERFVAQRNETQ